MAATTVNFYMTVPGLSQAEVISQLKALANECHKPWTIHIAAEPNSTSSGKMTVVARDGSTTPQVKDTMIALAKAHNVQGFAVRDILSSMSKIRAMGKAAKTPKKVIQASVHADHAYTAMVAATDPSPPDAYFPPAGTDPVKTVGQLDVNAPGADNPTFNSPDDLKLWSFGENILALCNFAARQDVQPFITDNKLDLTKTSDLNLTETKVAYYTFQEFNDLFSSCIVPDSTITYDHQYTTTSVDINLTLISDLLKGMSLNPAQLASAVTILSGICDDVKQLQISWSQGHKDQSMALMVRNMTKTQVGTTQLAIRFFLFTFSEDTFNLTVGKSSVNKLTINIGFLDYTGSLNRAAYEPSDSDVLDVLGGGVKDKITSRFKKATVPPSS